jgi:hypothetical protein
MPVFRFRGLAFLLCGCWLLLSCGGGGGGAGPSSNPVVITQPVSISISPSIVQLPRGGWQQFQAKVLNAVNVVTWKVNGVVGGNDTVGRITAKGLFTAPWITTPTSVKVTAVASADPTKSASVVVAVTLDTVQLTLTPSSTLTLLVNRTQQFTAEVTGTSNTAVTWRVGATIGGAPIVGTISTSGLYKAPSSVPATSGVTISAEAQVQPGFSVSTGILLFSTSSINQGEQSAPVELGTSGGNALDRVATPNVITCCSGTLGALVSRAGTQYVLSNNHVLARSDQALPGEGISQPGLVDFNCGTGPLVAQFTQAAPLKTSNVDAAIARVIPGQVDPSGAILQLDAAGGSPPLAAAPASTTLAPAVGMPVAKSGRTTGLSCANIQSVHVSATIEYEKACGTGNTFSVPFTNQFVVAGGAFSSAGDSGSLIVSSSSAEAVGLLFAGNSSSTVANPIQSVLAALPDSNSVVPTIVGGAPHSIPCNWFSSGGQPLPSLAAAEVARTRDVKDLYALALMKDPAVFAVGVGADDDVPGRAVVVVYVDAARHPGSIPPLLDGVPTKVIRSEHFRAFGWNQGRSFDCGILQFPLRTFWELLKY